MREGLGGGGVKAVATSMRQQIITFSSQEQCRPDMGMTYPPTDRGSNISHPREAVSGIIRRALASMNI